MKAPRPSRWATGLSVVLLCAAAVGCSGSGTSASNEAAASSTSATSAAAGLRLVSLGDSDATGAGDEEGAGWVQRYADLVAEETGEEVEVAARAQNGTTSSDLLTAVRGNASLRDDVAAADIVVIGAGGADLNAGDDAWAAGSCSGTACYEPALATYAENIEQIVAAVAELRADRPTVLRAMTPPNPLTGAEDVIPAFLAPVATEVGVFQSRSLRDSTCAALRRHGGECIDGLTAVNGPDGTEDGYAAGLLNHDDCCYPNAKGHQLIAELLLETGVEARALS